MSERIERRVAYLLGASGIVIVLFSTGNYIDQLWRLLVYFAAFFLLVCTVGLGLLAVAPEDVATRVGRRWATDRELLAFLATAAFAGALLLIAVLATSLAYDAYHHRRSLFG